MVKGGYGAITAALAAGLNVRLSCPVVCISDDSSGVHVTLADGKRPRVIPMLPDASQVLGLVMALCVVGSAHGL